MDSVIKRDETETLQFWNEAKHGLTNHHQFISILFYHNNKLSTCIYHSNAAVSLTAVYVLLIIDDILYIYK